MLPLPAHYSPASARDQAYAPDIPALHAAALAWRKRHALAPAARDEERVVLLLIDVQKDFCFPGGSLYVGGRSGEGALEDNARTAELIYENLGSISEIICTQDTHHPFQIFFPSFWQTADGGPVEAHRVITAAELEAGALIPRPGLAAALCDGDEAWLRAQCLDYCRRLEAEGRYQLYLWPPHCLLGGDGHLLAGVIQEARLFHSFARGARNPIELKGEHPLTENYSVLRPEVLEAHDGSSLGSRNEALIERLLGADRLLVAGQAASHCVKSSLDDLLEALLALEPGQASKVTVLRDCMSSVAVPDGAGGFVFDFTPQAEEALARYAEAGMRVCASGEA